MVAEGEKQKDEDREERPSSRSYTGFDDIRRIVTIRWSGATMEATKHRWRAMTRGLPLAIWLRARLEYGQWSEETRRERIASAARIDRAASVSSRSRKDRRLAKRTIVTDRTKKVKK
jgi:hypothetical protein